MGIRRCNGAASMKQPPNLPKSASSLTPKSFSGGPHHRHANNNHDCLILPTLCSYATR